MRLIVFPDSFAVSDRSTRLARPPVSLVSQFPYALSLAPCALSPLRYALGAMRRTDN